MKTIFEIISNKKADIEREIDLLSKRHKLFENIKNQDIYIVNTYEYLFSLSILVKQEKILDEVLASYYSQEVETEFANIHVGKEV